MKLLTLSLCIATALASDLPSFDYDRKLAFDIKETGVETREGIKVRDITFANLKGGRTAAYMVEPKAGRKHPSILFVHWYEPESPNSNRTQYLGQAVELAKLGVRSLLVETMWSEPQWFPTRKREDDFENTVAQTKELRRALDVLLAQKNADLSRVAYVGHDFGMMFGSLLPRIDGRPTVYALQAGTPHWADWYLYGPKMPEPQRTQFVEKLSVIDPVRHIGAAAGKPVFLQFGEGDRHVPEARAKLFADATAEPKKVITYKAEHPHALNQQAIDERVAWLKEQLKLK